MLEETKKAKIPALIPDSQFPDDAIRASAQVFPDASTPGSSMVYTWNIASAADAITAWGRAPMQRDRQLRDFWPSESYLAGAIVNVCWRNAAFDWEIRGPSTSVEHAVTDMLRSAIAGSAFGWTEFAESITEDAKTQDNGFFIELIREPTMDAASPFKNERAPVLGIAHLDANQCVRTGNPEYPVYYTDRNGKTHKLAWYQVIPFSELPSTIETMNGVGYCAVTRVLRLAQIMKSICVFKDEKISGRQYKQIHIVSGPSRQDIDDIKKRGQEQADNMGLTRYIEPAILASLDPEKPVSVATINLANLPDGFDYDQEMKWYISGLALGFGEDYQEFAPLPGGGIGSSNQSTILHRKSSGKGPAMFMKIAEALKNYGAMPRNCEQIFEDRDEEKVIDKQTLRKMFQEEMALAIRNDFMDPQRARQIGIERGLYTKEDFAGLPDNYGVVPVRSGPKQNIGPTGDNTVSADAARTDVGTPNNTIGARLRKMISRT